MGNLPSIKLPLTVKDLQSLSTERLQEARYKCQTNLFWFADRILRNKKDPPLLEKVHGGICNTLVHKNPNLPLEEWSPIKQRVILSSRGTLKTVLESADITQIILCDPNVRILLMSGKLDLAKSILGLCRGYFLSCEVLQYLFPDFCTEIDGPSDAFNTPAKGADINYREPTLSIATFESTKAGGHYNWLKLDDATSEINCATTILVEKTVQSYDDLDPLLEPGGYIDFTATRWAKEDLPEIIRQRGEEYKQTDEYQSTKIPQVLYFFQPIWTVNKGKSDQEQKEIDDREKKGKLHPADVTLLWPEKLNAKFLWPQYRANRKKFACLPAGAPVLMADWTEKPIEKMQVGDEIVGFDLGAGKDNGRRGKKGKGLVPAVVEAIHRERAEVIKVTTSVGRVFYCTPDHQWLRVGRSQDKHAYGTLKTADKNYGLPTGTRIVSVYTPQPPKTLEEQRELDWLGGMFDGEGTVNGSLFIAQSKVKNPAVWKALNECFERMGVLATKYDGTDENTEESIFHLAGGRSLRIRLLQHARMYKTERFRKALWKQSSNTQEEGGTHHVVSIESVGEQEVYNIQSSTGNYVAYGYASKNCQYLLNPESVAEDVHFTLQLLERQTRPINELPQPHRSAGCFINWDLAGIRSESGDYSVGLCGEWEYPAEQGIYGRLFIVDCIMEKFESSTEAAHAIVNFYKKHDPTRCRIEDAAGAKYCEGEILALAKSLGVNIQISWIPPETTKDAKIERVIDLVDVLKKDKIQFWSGLPHLQDLYNQFMKFSRKSKTKDDGPDCLAQLWKEYKGQIHPALIPRLQPSEVPIQWIPRESPDSEENQIDADELSAAQDNRFTMPHA